MGALPSISGFDRFDGLVPITTTASQVCPRASTTTTRRTVQKKTNQPKVADASFRFVFLRTDFYIASQRYCFHQSLACALRSRDHPRHYHVRPSETGSRKICVIQPPRPRRVSFSYVPSLFVQCPGGESRVWSLEQLPVVRNRVRYRMPLHWTAVERLNNGQRDR